MGVVFFVSQGQISLHKVLTTTQPIGGKAMARELLGYEISKKRNRFSET